MPKPLRIPYASTTHVPAVAELLHKVTRTRHVVLEFPPTQTKELVDAFIERLTQEIPEHYRLIRSYSHSKLCVSILERVHRDDVIKMEEALLLAAKHFRDTATALAHALAKHNQVPVGRLLEYADDLEPFDSKWAIYFHGPHCLFEHEDTGQSVEVNLLFGEEFGALDPYFFQQYINTTAELTYPTGLNSDFHDPAWAMDIMEERGSLMSIECQWGHGLIVAPAQTP